MEIVDRLLLREEIDALERELFRGKSAANPDAARVQMLKQEILRLERRISTRQQRQLRPL